MAKKVIIHVVKVAVTVAILALIFPGVAKTEDNYEFVVMGNGPVGDQVGMPMAVAVHKDGSVSVFDASNSSHASPLSGWSTQSAGSIRPCGRPTPTRTRWYASVPSFWWIERRPL